MCRALGTGEKKSLRNFHPTKLAGQGGLLKLLCFSAELPIVLPALWDSFRASRAMSCEFPSPPSPVILSCLCGTPTALLGGWAPRGGPAALGCSSAHPSIGILGWIPLPLTIAGQVVGCWFWSSPLFMKCRHVALIPTNRYYSFFSLYYFRVFIRTFQV